MRIDVLVLMGSQSDAGTMVETCRILHELGISYESRITSAHRTPERMAHAAISAAEQGFRVVIAGAGGSAHLPGMVASHTELPVIAVAVPSSSSVINDIAAIFSSIQMPGGVPLVYAGLGKAGAINAALGAARILALSDPAVHAKLADWIAKQEESVPAEPTFVTKLADEPVPIASPPNN